MRVKLEDVCKRIYAGGDVPKDRYSEVKTDEYSVPIYANAEKDEGLYGYTDKARENELSITVAARGTIGFTSIRREPFLPVVRLITVVPDTKKVSERYLYYVLKNCKSYSTGTSIPQLTVPDIKKKSFELCNIHEQEEIADRLDKVNEIIQLRKKELQLLEELIKARFVEMFESMKETCEVGYYIKSLIAGKSLAGESECENKVLKTGAVSFDYFDSRQVKNLPNDYKPQKQHLVNVGDIIISRMNTAELTGAAAYVWKVPKNVYIPDRLWKAVLGEKSNPIFVWQMLIQPSTKEQIQKECSGTSGSMKNISKAGMLGIKVKKVPYDMQNEFADFVCQVDKSKVVVQKALDEAQLLFDSLMQKYFG